MPKQLRLPLALVVVLCLLGGMAYWDDWQTKKDEVVKKSKSQLFVLRPEEVTEIEYQRHDLNKKIDFDLTAKRSGPGMWSVESPIKTKGDAFSIDNLLRQILEYQAEDQIDASPDKMADYGLEKPEIRIVMHAGDKTVALRIGSKTPVGSSLYSMIEGSSKIIVGSQYLTTAVTKTLHDFRNKALTDLAAEDVTKLSVKRSRGDYVLSKSDKGQWQQDGGNLALDQVAVAEFISDLRGQNVQTFIDAPTPEDQKIFATPKPEERVAVSVVDKLGAETSFVVVSRGEEVWITSDPTKQIFKLGKDAYPKFNRDVMFFYDKVLAEVNPTDVNVLNVAGRKLKKEGVQWLVDDSKDVKAETTEMVASLANNLATLKADQVHPLDAKTKIPSEEPVYTVELGSRDPKGLLSTVTFQFWKDKADPLAYLATSSQKSTLLFTVPRTILQQIEDVVAKLPNRAAASGGTSSKG